MAGHLGGAFESGLGGTLGEVAGGNAESATKAHPRASYVAPFFGLRGAPLRLKMAFLGLRSAEVWSSVALLSTEARSPKHNSDNKRTKMRPPTPGYTAQRFFRRPYCFAKKRL